MDLGKLWSEAVKSRGIPAAPTKEALSLRAYSARCRLNRLRRKACRFYQRPECVAVVARLETAIDRGYLAIRKDRLTHADLGGCWVCVCVCVVMWLMYFFPQNESVPFHSQLSFLLSGLKQQMLQLLLCYNPLWLRVGMETVYGELLHLSGNNDITGITHYVITRYTGGKGEREKLACSSH